jgi:cell division protein ZapA
MHMGQVTLQLNGKSYRLRCGDGEEPHLNALAEDLRLRIERLALEAGQLGDERLLLMAALFVTDELWEAKARLQALEGERSAVTERLAALERAAAEAAARESPRAGPPPAAVPTPDEPGAQPLDGAAPTSAAAPSVTTPIGSRRPPGARGSLEERLAEARAASRNRGE